MNQNINGKSDDLSNQSQKDTGVKINLTLEEKILLKIIMDLNSKDEPCFASNTYFATIMGLKHRRISQIIRSLVRKKVLNANYTYQGKKIVSRTLIPTISDSGCGIYENLIMNEYLYKNKQKPDQNSSQEGDNKRLSFAKSSKTIDKLYSKESGKTIKNFLKKLYKGDTLNLLLSIFNAKECDIPSLLSSNSDGQSIKKPVFYDKKSDLIPKNGVFFDEKSEDIINININNINIILYYELKNKLDYLSQFLNKLKIAQDNNKSNLNINPDEIIIELIFNYMINNISTDSLNIFTKKLNMELSNKLNINPNEININPNEININPNEININPNEININSDNLNISDLGNISSDTLNLIPKKLNKEFSSQNNPILNCEINSQITDLGQHNTISYCEKNFNSPVTDNTQNNIDVDKLYSGFELVDFKTIIDTKPKYNPTNLAINTNPEYYNSNPTERKINKLSLTQLYLKERYLVPDTITSDKNFFIATSIFKKYMFNWVERSGYYDSAISSFLGKIHTPLHNLRKSYNVVRDDKTSENFLEHDIYGYILKRMSANNDHFTYAEFKSFLRCYLRAMVLYGGKLGSEATFGEILKSVVDDSYDFNDYEMNYNNIGLVIEYYTLGEKRFNNKYEQVQAGEYVDMFKRERKEKQKNTKKEMPEFELL